MKTIIVSENGSEFINSNLKFIVKINSKRLDMFVYNHYLNAKLRIETLQKILTYSKFEIIIIEE